MLLQVSDLSVQLGGLQILQDINLYAEAGELVVVVGANGAGKSTLLRTISGLNGCVKGTIEFDGKEIQNKKAYDVAAMGLSMMPEGRQLFPELTAKENLQIGAYTYRKDKARVQKNLERVFKLFPVLEQNQSRIGATFSGGEQQMISIGRALMSEPKLLLIDELSLGLAPIIISELFGVIKDLNKSGISILLIEQNAKQALKIADRAYVLENGKLVKEGTGNQLLNDPAVKEAYLGI